MESHYILRIARGTNVRDYPLDRDVTSIGRNNDNTVILDDENVSRRHAEIKYIDGKLHITDLGSSNGTIIKGVAIEPDTPWLLTEKDVVSIGGYMLTLIPGIIIQSPVTEETTKTMPASATVATTVSALDTHSRGIKSKSAGASGSSGLNRMAHLSWTRLSIIIGIVVLIIGVLAIVITQQRVRASVTNDDIALTLTVIAQKGMDDSSQALTDLDIEADDLMDRLLQLEYLISDSRRWIERQVSREHTSDDMFIAIDDEGMRKLENERYQVTELSVQINTDEYEYTLNVTDLASGQTQSAEALQNALFSRMEEVKQRIQQELEVQDSITSTLHDVLSFSSTWTVKKLKGGTYIVDGEGLGWSDKLTSGTWNYDVENLEMIPRDQQSSELNAILSGK
jgi:pSer/pThr/pTyr-binding forkhead associated (FHA) protein